MAGSALIGKRGKKVDLLSSFLMIDSITTHYMIDEMNK